MDYVKNETAEEASETQEQPSDKLGAVVTKNDGISLYCLTVIGQIEGHFILPNTQKTTKYEHVLPLLAAIEENPELHGLLVIINTVGGDVEAGLAIAEMIASLSKPTVSLPSSSAADIPSGFRLRCRAAVLSSCRARR